MKNITKALTINAESRGVKEAVLHSIKNINLFINDLPKSGKIGIVTGFYIPSYKVCETDGPAGSASLASTFKNLGYDVTLITDKLSANVVRIAAEIAGVHFFEADESSKLDFDVLVYIERGGANKDGLSKTMRNITVEGQVCLFRDSPVSLAIGDGGNEEGTGSTEFCELLKNVPHIEDIAAHHAAKHILFANVSNFGALAVCKCLNAQKDEIKKIYFKVLEETNKIGSCDGINANKDCSVDNYTKEQQEEIISMIFA